VEELKKDFAPGRFFHNSSSLRCRSRARKIFLLQFFHNSSTILPRMEEFGASRLAWGRNVEGIIVEELWKHLVNAAPAVSVSTKISQAEKKLFHLQAASQNGIPGLDDNVADAAS
jgi:hypothetical protein